MAYTIQFSPRARDQLQSLRKRDQQIILDAIAAQFANQPDQPTRNRKRLQENPLAPWELRVGNFQLFYDLEPAEQQVVIVAVGRKNHNTLRIGGEEVEL